MEYPENAVEVRGLRKVYRAAGDLAPIVALKGLDLGIPRGSFFGLLGPNGAGKSTFINILGGMVDKSSGRANVWGFDIDKNPRNARASIGVVPQEICYDAFFTPKEALDLQAGLYGVPKADRRTDEILAAVHLSDKANAYARTLSGGMKRRLLVAKALVHSPPILILDEPTAGVDVELRQQLWDYVRELNEQGTTIVLTTHYLEEAEELCDQIAIINHGKLVANEPTDSLLRRIEEKDLAIRLDRDVDVLPKLLLEHGGKKTGPREVTVRYSAQTRQVGEIISAVNDAGYEIVDLTTTETDLEDIFMQLTRREQP
jgi:ABC-2 type transport system ATP-binding protein